MSSSEYDAGQTRRGSAPVAIFIEDRFSCRALRPSHDPAIFKLIFHRNRLQAIFQSDKQFQTPLAIPHPGGARRDRTDDLMLAKHALSQLSYGPVMVGLGGLEPPTSRLSSARSNQLSYKPGPDDRHQRTDLFHLSSDICPPNSSFAKKEKRRRRRPARGRKTDDRRRIVCARSIHCVLSRK
jgi:hypothetical protein